MKLLALLLPFAFAASASTFAGNGASEVRTLLDIQKSTNVSKQARLQGFEIRRTNKPIIRSEYREFRAFLAENEAAQQELFNQVVDSGELDYLGDDRDKIKSEAKKHFDVKYLFEISRVFEITKDGELVGYIFDITEHGQAEVYQDGAWSEVYVDKNFQVIYRDQQSS